MKRSQQMARPLKISTTKTAKRLPESIFDRVVGSQSQNPIKKTSKEVFSNQLRSFSLEQFV